jgi:NitT/TauT family transport system ATP-binding protein
MTPILSLDRITRTFRDGETACPALSGVSFDIAQNEILCIMGPSGCGKSTLLRIISGLEHADAGSVGEVRATGDRLTAAMVFQDHALFPWLTVYDNLVYGLTLAARTVPEAEIKKRADTLLALTHLEGFRHAYPHQLSGGMKQRVSVARALAIKPDILLLDEPFSALDTFTRRELEDEVKRIRDRMNTTVVVVTHDPEEAVYLADRIVILSPRPSSVAVILPVNLPSPRDPADPEFIRIRKEVTLRIRNNGEKPVPPGAL